MKRLMSVVVIAAFVAGSAAFACSGCGCEAKKSSEEKKECGSCKTEKKETACSGAHKSEKEADKKAA